jgi:F-type H+-transporting ATPase subunit delta
LSAKSNFSNSTANSYALALYELSIENSVLDIVGKEMNSLYKLLSESSDFKEMILNPMVQKEDKQKIIHQIADKNKFSETTKKFLGLVSIKNRLFFLEKIIVSFLNLISTGKGELKAKLISSKELSVEEKEKIQEELSKDFKSTLNIDYKFDPNLIGGLVIQIGSIMVDASIKTKLKKLEKNMLEA